MNIQNHIIRHLALLLAGVTLAFTTTAHAVNRTWNGAGTDDLWSTDANWGGTAPAATGDSLFFAGSTRLTPTNTTVTSLNGITFNAGAGSFTLSGSTFILNGNIANNSGVLQTIDNNMTLNSNGGRTIDTAQGDVIVNGAIGQDSGSRVLKKTGTGTLTLAGANTFAGSMLFLQGKLLLTAGASFAAGGDFFLGANSTPDALNQPGILEARGAAAGTTTITVAKRLYLGRSTGNNQIIVNSNGGSGTTLSFSDFNRLTSVDSVPTLHIDLSSSGSALSLVSAPALTGDIYRYVTVTDATKTGFATRDTGTGAVTRYTPVTTLVDGAGNANTNYNTSGIALTTATVQAGSVTITGTGSITGTSTRLSTTAILMEESVGDFTIDTDTLGLGGAQLYIHQYSSAGTLVINSDLYATSDSVNNSMVKTGPGTLVFNGDATHYTGVADVQGGTLQVHGSLAQMGYVQVRDGATLGGRGSIGTSGTVINVWSGGTLDASNALGAKALSLTGTLLLTSDATYQMDLVGSSFAALSVTGNVTLNGDLKLTLNYTPVLNSEIDLMTSSGTISGTFATINGAAATSSFTMGDYTFDINYGANRVWLKTTVVPEPGTVMLLLLAAALLRIHRRKGLEVRH